MKEFTINFTLTRTLSASIIANSREEAIAKILKEMEENGTDTCNIESEEATDFDVSGEKEADPLEAQLFG